MAVFSTGTYAIIGTTCFESETCYEMYHEKKTFFCVKSLPQFYASGLNSFDVTSHLRVTVKRPVFLQKMLLTNEMIYVYSQSALSNFK